MADRMQSVDCLGVKVEIANHGLGEIFKPHHSMGWSLIFRSKERPEWMTLVIQPHAEKDVSVFFVQGGKSQRAEEWGGKYILRVPVEWKWDGKDEMPHTRVRGQDNVDVIFLKSDGSFIDVQVGIVTHSCSFYLTIQQVYEGVVTRTRGVKVGEVRYTFVPTQHMHAYPGASYEAIWGPMAEELGRVAKEEEASKQKSRVRSAEWITPAVPSLEGWSRAEVLYWNLITRTCRIRDLDSGQIYFVHWSKVLMNDIGISLVSNLLRSKMLGNVANPLPYLVPMRGVYYRPDTRPSVGAFPNVKSVKIAA